MVVEIITEAVRDAQAVRFMLASTDKLRQLTANDGEDERHAKNNPIIAAIIADLPGSNEWRMLEHCATLTRLYAIYERCISNAVRAWLSDLPTTVASYGAFGSTFANNHRKGVARVLLDLEKDRFSHLSAAQVMAGLLAAVNGDVTYSILAEAFLSENRTLKRDRIDELCAQVRLEGGWHWISQHRYVTEFITLVRGGQNTAEAELRSFVNDRNDAAHGSVDQVLGTGPLSEYADFVVAICRSLGELVLWNKITSRERKGDIKAIGSVTEHFRNNVVVAKLSHCQLAVGREVVLFGERYCYPATVDSIQVNDVSYAQVMTGDETEVGLRFTCKPERYPKLFLDI